MNNERLALEKREISDKKIAHWSPYFITLQRQQYHFQIKKMHLAVSKVYAHLYLQNAKNATQRMPVTSLSSNMPKQLHDLFNVRFFRKTQ